MITDIVISVIGRMIVAHVLAVYLCTYLYLSILHLYTYIYINIIGQRFFYAAPRFFLCCLACGFFFYAGAVFFYAEGPSVCHIPLFLMLQGVLLYAVGCLSLCYRGLVLMPFGSGDCSNP